MLSDEIRQTEKRHRKAENEHLNDINRLLDSLEKLSLAFESVSEGIRTENLDGIITEVNNRAVQMYGYSSKKDLIGKDALELISPGDRERARQEMQEALQSKEVSRFNYTLVRADGSEFIGELGYSVLRTKIGNPLGYVTICRDITQQTLDKKALIEAKKSLEGRVKERTAELSKAKEQLEYYLGEVIRAQEEERKRIARELHDEASPSLGFISLELDNIIAKNPGLSEDVVSRLRTITEKLRMAQEEIRLFSHELHPSVLDQLGLESALETLISDLNSKDKVLIKFRVKGKEQNLSDDVKLALYRITQEALNNVWKHSQAPQALVGLHYAAKGVKLTITDNGIGFDPSKSPNGLGVTGMKERAHLIGGSLKIESRLSQGTKITVEV
jgi:PAS domain S-box-containing protein